MERPSLAKKSIAHASWLREKLRDPNRSVHVSEFQAVGLLFLGLLSSYFTSYNVKISFYINWNHLLKLR